MVVYTSTDGGTWTAMGAAVTGTGVTSIFDSTAEWIIGARGTYSPNTIGSNLNGTVYEVDVRSGIGGYSVLPRLPEAWPIYSSDSGGIAVVQIVGSPALHVVNSSHPGAGITYFTAGDRLSRMTPDYGQVGVIFSTSHNETKRAGDFPAQFSSLITATKARLPRAQVAITTQNPQIAPRTDTQIAEHAGRNAAILTFAAQNGYSTIDAYRAFLTSGSPLSSLIATADGVHPVEPAGNKVWGDAAIYAARQRS
ncbi:MAG: SGNH/GDSL hydrolase family protein [Nonomuraea sp.]|nr:SGNH/GDSL hydrolase family protein [Nonomuraea sp.]